MSLIQLLFGFNGRIRRTNYWLAAIGSGFVLSIIFLIVFFVFGGAGALAANAVNGGDSNTLSNAGAAAVGGLGLVLVLIFLVYFAISLWIGLALQVKRWHDRDKSGIWVLIGLIPLVGPIWALIECGFLDGTLGPNQYGPSPKGIVAPPQLQPTGPTAPPIAPVI